jgi:hypothetical protein
MLQTAYVLPCNSNGYTFNFNSQMQQLQLLEQLAELIE